MSAVEYIRNMNYTQNGEVYSDPNKKPVQGNLDYTVEKIQKMHNEHKVNARDFIIASIVAVVGLVMVAIGIVFASNSLNLTNSSVVAGTITGFLGGTLLTGMGVCIGHHYSSKQKALRKKVNEEVNELYRTYTAHAIITKRHHVDLEIDAKELESLNDANERLSKLRCGLEYTIDVDYKVDLSGGLVSFFKRTAFTAIIVRDDGDYQTKLRDVKAKQDPWIRLFREAVKANVAPCCELRIVLELARNMPSDRINRFTNATGERTYTVDFKNRQFDVTDSQGHGYVHLGAGGMRHYLNIPTSENAVMVDSR